jgi:hypothetical protein
MPATKTIQPDGSQADGVLIGLASTDKVGFHGATPVVRPVIAAAGSDAGTTQTLANSIRTILINNGLASAS